MHHTLADASDKLFSAYTPALLQTLEMGAADPVWAEVEASGFLDLLVGDDHEESRTLADLPPLLLAAGYHGVPAPIGTTILLRGVLGGEAPPGSITIAHPLQDSAYRADWVVAEDDAGMLLRSMRSRVPDVMLPPDIDCTALGALAGVLKMAGAMRRASDMTIQYAKDRQQFGRPIASFQAIQQMISRMIEQVASAEAATGIVCGADRSVADLDRTRLAVAKVVVGSSAARVSEFAHAVHGAIGMAQEHELHRYTRILQQERLAFGGDLYWARSLGRAALATDRPYLLDFVRKLEIGS